jgi:malonyl-CoA O-methyltransferase
MTERAMLLDKREVRRAFDRAADNYDAHAMLQKEISRRLMERLDYIKLEPEIMLDAGCGTGSGLKELNVRFPRARGIALDLSPAMLGKAKGTTPLWKRLLQGRSQSSVGYVCGDIEQLPVKSSSIDFLWSSLALQWASDAESALHEFRRVLRPGGLLMFATFGPDTLKELRSSFSTVDDKPHVSQFVDMHDIGDMLMHLGFQHPVMEMERLVLTYQNLKALMQDLKNIGAHNADGNRARGMLGRHAWERLELAYEQHRTEGRLPATYEVIYGHAWAGNNDRLPDGRQVIHLNTGQRGTSRGKH